MADDSVHAFPPRDDLLARPNRRDERAGCRDRGLAVGLKVQALWEELLAGPVATAAAHRLLTDQIPTGAAVNDRIGLLLRELEIARKLMRVAETADRYRRLNHDTREAIDARH